MIKSLLKYLILLLFTSYSVVKAQSYEDIKRLQDQYNEVLKRKSLQKPVDISNAENIVKSSSLPDKLLYTRKDIESLLVNTEKLLKKLKFLEDSTDLLPYIGYDIFSSRDTIPFWQNLPIPKHYNLGPGDEIIISLWGETESNISNTINKDGQVFIENIGILNLGSKTVSEAKEYIISKYSRVYSTLLGDNPKSFIDITLGELKSVNVHFVGFVNIPGVHMIHPFSNVITGIIQAGGVSKAGSLRDIHIIRNGKKIRSFDLYNYIFLGQTISDIRLIDQDIIFIPARLSTISLTGHIQKPGYYEVLENEPLSKLIAIGGGKKVNGSNTIMVYNYNNENNGYILKNNEISNFMISNGDSIYVPNNPSIRRSVYIGGHIKNPGTYPYQKNMRLQDLIDATISVNDLEFMKTVNFSNIIINRKNISGDYPLRIEVDLNKNNIILSNDDHITIPKLNNFQPIESVQITGEVRMPGVYPVNNLTSLSNVLDFAGGYTIYALNNGIEVFRDTIKIGWEEKNFILQAGDSLNVLKKSGLVLLKGEVNVPGYLNYNKGDSIKDYIKRAGGYSSFAEVKDVIVIYPNGIAYPNKSWFPPKVLEGSTIVVNERKLTAKSNGLTGWEAFSLISSQAGNIATTLLTLSILMNQSGGLSGN